MFVTMDYNEGIIFIPKELFNSSKEKIISHFENFIFNEKEDMIVLQSTKKLPNKKNTEIFYKGVLKNGATCNFCEKRLVCSTNGWKCTGYKQAKPFEHDFVNIESYLETISTILYVKAE